MRVHTHPRAFPYVVMYTFVQENLLFPRLTHENRNECIPHLPAIGGVIMLQKKDAPTGSITATHSLSFDDGFSLSHEVA